MPDQLPTPASLLDWHAYHVAMRTVMSATTADWVKRGIIRQAGEIKIRKGNTHLRSGLKDNQA